jgi:hypothetical protein
MWAAVGTATTSEADDFAADRVIMVRKGEADKGGGVEIGAETGTNIEAVVTHEELVDQVRNSAVGDGGRRTSEEEIAHHN